MSRIVLTSALLLFSCPVSATEPPKTPAGPVPKSPLEAVSALARTKPEAVLIVEPDMEDEGPACSDNSYNTSLSWLDSPEQAAQQALAHGKLVFLIQISGNFAKEEFT